MVQSPTSEEESEQWLYGKLEDMLALEEVILKKEKVEFGDPEVSRHNRLVEELPKLYSLKDMIKYHQALKRMIIADEVKQLTLANDGLTSKNETLQNLIFKRKEEVIAHYSDSIRKVLYELSGSCTPEAYSNIKESFEKHFEITS